MQNLCGHCPSCPRLRSNKPGSHCFGSHRLLIRSVCSRRMHSNVQSFQIPTEQRMQRSGFAVRRHSFMQNSPSFFWGVQSGALACACAPIGMASDCTKHLMNLMGFGLIWSGEGCSKGNVGWCSLPSRSSELRSSNCRRQSDERVSSTGGPSKGIGLTARSNR